MKGLSVILLLLGMSSTGYAQSLPLKACEVLKRERAKYPISLRNVCLNSGQSNCPLGNMLNTAASESGLGLAFKNSGYWVTSPAGPIASDILMNSSKLGWDVFSDAENTARVNCGNTIGTITNRPYVSPVGSITPPTTCETKLLELQHKIDNARCEIIWP